MAKKMNDQEIKDAVRKHYGGLVGRRAGPTGKVIGLDMTPEMVARARANARRAGLQNVEFRLGDAEKMPVDDASVDLVISNCVINLAPDKDRVFSEAFRVLKNGGRLMISDMVAEGLPDQLLEDRGAWCSCISGAMPEREYLGTIRRAGFSEVRVLARADLAPRFLGGAPDLKISSIRVGAVKTVAEDQSTICMSQKTVWRSQPRSQGAR